MVTAEQHPVSKLCCVKLQPVFMVAYNIENFQYASHCQAMKI